MADPRFNDISRKLRALALDLEKQAADHRRIADQLDAITAAPDPRDTAPAPHLAALDAAALQLVNLPAADIRGAAPAVARCAGLQVLPVALRAQHIRKDRKAAQRRAQTVKIMTALASGMTMKQTAAKMKISEATVRRRRDGWRNQS